MCIRDSTYADRLIDAGLDNLKVSLQGITSEKYQKICKTAVDFDRLKEQLFYFYEHRKQCSLHIKVIDIALDEGEEEQFYQMFDGHADSLFVEQCIGEYALHPEESSNKFQFDTSHMQTCSLPFYTPVSYTHLDVYKRQFLGRFGGQSNRPFLYPSRFDF